MSHPFVEAVRDTIEREGLLPRGSAVVVGVSGGPDSMALWRALLDLRQDLGITVRAAHLDHGWRDDSADDAAFVAEWGRAWGETCLVRRLEGPPPGSNREAAGRAARYDFLHEVADPLAARIAVAHHADDRLETFVMQWIRGAGPRGLSHPRPARADGVVRPLLERTRAEVMAFLRDAGVPFRTDPTNLDDSNLRSRVRRSIVPALLHENPEIARATARTMTILGAVDDYLASAGRAALAELTLPCVPGEFDLDGVRGQAYHPVILSWALREAIGPRGDASGAGFEAIRACVDAWTEGRTCVRDLPGGARVAVGPDRVRVTFGELPRAPIGAIPIPGTLRWDATSDEAETPLGCLRVEAAEPPEEPAQASTPTVGWIDADRVVDGLRVRGRREGDRYRPWGLSGHASVQDLMVDRKVPVGWRDSLPIVTDAEGIVWIPGFRVDQRLGITETTKRALRLSFTGALASFFSENR
jgi:tRNA(Ile)-lysidine synthase